MHVHIFQDGLGLYTVSTVDRVASLNLNEGETIFINITGNENVKTNKNIVLLPTNWKVVKDYFKSLEYVNFVYFHSYNFYSQAILKLLNKKSKSVKFFWVFWSGEFYNLPRFSANHYIGKSYDFFPERNLIRRIKNWLYHINQWLMRRPFFFHSHFIKSFKEIDFFCSVLESDFKAVQNYSKASFKHLRFAYVPYNQYFNSSHHLQSHRIFRDKPVVMLNHSGDPILNHFDGLDRVMALNQDCRIVLLLSYGAKANIDAVSVYAKCIVEKDNLLIIYEKLLPDAYMNFLLTVDVAIFNSTIQKGIGNILPLIWFGAKVFLRNENSVYKDFKKMGFIIFSVQNDLVLTNAFQPLSMYEKVHNRKILTEFLSEESVNNYYRNCFQ